MYTTEFHLLMFIFISLKRKNNREGQRDFLSSTQCYARPKPGAVLLKERMSERVSTKAATHTLSPHPSALGPSPDGTLGTTTKVTQRGNRLRHPDLKPLGLQGFLHARLEQAGSKTKLRRRIFSTGLWRDFFFLTLIHYRQTTGLN